MIVKRDKKFSSPSLFGILFPKTARRDAARKEEEEDRLRREKYRKDIEAYKKNIEATIIDEPLTYKELCSKYPKLKELDYIVKNEKKIIDLLEKVNSLDSDIFETVDSLTIFTGTEQTPKVYKKNNSKYFIQELRSRLRSSDWIPCFSSICDSLIYNKKQNKFYYLGVSSRSPEPITINQYCKKIMDKIAEDSEDSIRIESDYNRESQKELEAALKQNREDIRKLKQLLRV